jgi:hypothetical protein
MCVYITLASHSQIACVLCLYLQHPILEHCRRYWPEVTVVLRYVYILTASWAAMFSTLYNSAISMVMDDIICMYMLLSILCGHMYMHSIMEFDTCDTFS